MTNEKRTQRTLTHEQLIHLEHPLNMYDSLPYERDPDFCHPSQITMVRSRVFKAYNCVNGKHRKIRH